MSVRTTPSRRWGIIKKHRQLRLGLDTSYPFVIIWVVSNQRLNNCKDYTDVVILLIFFQSHSIIIPSLIKRETIMTVLTSINTDSNGHPRFVCHFLNFIKPSDRNLTVDEKYQIALKRAKVIGGKKFHNKQYGGGIAFQSYNVTDLQQNIQMLIG